MNYIGLFFGAFVLVYIVYYIFIVARKKSLQKLKTSKSMDYFKQLYKIDPEKINMKQFANFLGAANAFIIAVIITIIEIFDNLIVKLVAALILMIPTIYITYSLIGKYYTKDKNNLIHEKKTNKKKKDVKKCTTSKK